MDHHAMVIVWQRAVIEFDKFPHEWPKFGSELHRDRDNWRNAGAQIPIIDKVIWPSAIENEDGRIKTMSILDVEIVMCDVQRV